MGSDEYLDMARVSEEELEDLLPHLRERLRFEVAVLDIADKGVTLVGDTHGDLTTSIKIMERYLKSGSVLIFLGDYVDRGLNQIENVNLLLKLKEERWGQIILLRGNHETPSANRFYGFYDEVLGQYRRETYALYSQLFSELPYAAVINKKILALHGGLPSTVDDLSSLRSRLTKGQEEPEGTAFELLWNDPAEDLAGHAPSPRGPGIKLFGRDVTIRFLDRSDIAILVRSHEPVPMGYRFMWGERLLTIFSCSFYGIKPTVARVDGNVVRVETID